MFYAKQSSGAYYSRVDNQQQHSILYFYIESDTWRETYPQRNQGALSYHTISIHAGVLASAFSAGNSYVYCASRSLFGLALEGKAPKVLTKCTKQGVPYLCVAIVLAISLLSFLQLGENSAVVLSWFVSLVTASQLINFSVMCYTFLCFYKACKAQGLDRNTLPYTGILQPYAAYYALTATFIMTFVGGYTVFLPGYWDVPNFLFS